MLCKLRLGSDACRSSPGDLANDLELSSGAMTSRLDRLERGIKFVLDFQHGA